MSLLEDKVQQWKEEGFCVVSDLVDADTMKQCTQFLHKKWDTVDKCCKEFGSNGECAFPCGEVIDQLPINEKIIEFVKTLMSSDDVTLVQADAWSKAGVKPKEFKTMEDAVKAAAHKDSFFNQDSAFKKAETEILKDFWEYGNIMDNQDQRIHMDYGNNSFLHPGDWYRPETVAAIIYFHDTTISKGGTAVVPRKGEGDQVYQPPYINMPGYGGYRFINNRTAAENYFAEECSEVANLRQELYSREIIPEYKPGDILFYRMETWHRGTPLREGQIRTVMSLAWRRSDCFWYNTWNPGFTKKMYYGIIEKLFVDMSPVQRGTLGIPLPGHSYWTPHTINMLKARYPGIDTEPYEPALHECGK